MSRDVLETGSRLVGRFVAEVVSDSLEMGLDHFGVRLTHRFTGSAIERLDDLIDET